MSFVVYMLDKLMREGLEYKVSSHSLNILTLICGNEIQKNIHHWRSEIKK